MSNREPNPGDMCKEDGSDPQSSPAGYLGIKGSIGQKAFLVVGASNGSPALASSQSDGPMDLRTAETHNKEVDCTGAGVRPAPSAGHPHQSFVWVKSPTFHGVNMSWEEFIMQFNACATINGWTELEIGPHMFLNLEGEARSFIMGLRLQTLDYHVLVEKMESWFGSFGNRLRNRRWHNGETASSYASDIQWLVERAFPGCPEDVQQKLSLRTLLDGLLEGDLKHTLQCNDPKSVEEAVILMEGWEKASKEAGVPFREADEKGTHRDDVLVKMLEEILEQIKMIDINANGKRGKVICFHCGGEGHYKFQCKSRGKQTQGQNISQHLIESGSEVQWK